MKPSFGAELGISLQPGDSTVRTVPGYAQYVRCRSTTGSEIRLEFVDATHRVAYTLSDASKDSFSTPISDAIVKVCVTNVGDRAATVDLLYDTKDRK